MAEGEPDRDEGSESEEEEDTTNKKTFWEKISSMHSLLLIVVLIMVFVMNLEYFQKNILGGMSSRFYDPIHGLTISGVLLSMGFLAFAFIIIDVLQVTEII
jgi:hypothetical protein